MCVAYYSRWIASIMLTDQDVAIKATQGVSEAFQGYALLASEANPLHICSEIRDTTVLCVHNYVPDGSVKHVAQHASINGMRAHAQNQNYCEEWLNHGL